MRFDSNFAKRSLSSLVYVVIFLLMIYLGGWYYALFVATGSVVVTLELLNMSRTIDAHPSKWVAIIASVILVFTAYQGVNQWALVIILTFMLSPVWLLRWRNPISKSTILNWAITFLVIIYSGLFLQHAVLVRNLANGFELSILAVIGTWTCDTSAYLFGKYFGKRDFSPNISPNKTLEGAIGGYLASFVVICIVGYLFEFPLILTTMLAILLPAAVTLGDLTESIFKRSVGVKDSGTILPGHGGLLDRIDGLMFSFVTVYYVIILYLQI